MIDFGQISFKLSEKLFSKDPQSSEIGRKIVTSSIILIDEIGLDAFTLKKLAQDIGTTEATVYRYFESKQRILLYLLNWYWHFLDFYISLQTHHITQPRERLEKTIDILILDNEISEEKLENDISKLSRIVVKESYKAYFTHEVDKINGLELFDSYKKLCDHIAQTLLLVHPNYPYPHSLATTLIETIHQQKFFALHLPRLTDASKSKLSPQEYTQSYVQHLIRSLL